MKNITVVFDRIYLNHCIKDATHHRRSNVKQGRSIIQALTNSLVVEKRKFPMSKHDKQEFLLMLGNQKSDPGVSVYYANADVDFITEAY